mgnify:CR=1 FL=1
MTYGLQGREQIYRARKDEKSTTEHMTYKLQNQTKPRNHLKQNSSN